MQVIAAAVGRLVWESAALSGSTQDLTAAGRPSGRVNRQPTRRYGVHTATSSETGEPTSKKEDIGPSKTPPDG